MRFGVFFLSGAVDIDVGGMDEAGCMEYGVRGVGLVVAGR